MLNESVTNTKEKLLSKLNFLGSLRRMGEEPYEIESYVNEVAELFVEEFTSWLHRGRVDYPAESGQLVAFGLTRFIYLSPGRPSLSPLNSGKKTHDAFLKDVVEQMKLPVGSSFILKEGIRLFVEFRKTLKFDVH